MLFAREYEGRSSYTERVCVRNSVVTINVYI